MLTVISGQNAKKRHRTKKMPENVAASTKCQRTKNIYILIGWQAYRGDQIHRKNSPT